MRPPSPVAAPERPEQGGTDTADPTRAHRHRPLSTPEARDRPSAEFASHEAYGFLQKHELPGILMRARKFYKFIIITIIMLSSHDAKSRNEHLNEFSAAPTARESVALLLRDAVEKVTDPKNPGSGCFGVQGAMTCFNMSRQVKEHIGDMHAAFERLCKKRFNRAIEAGELPRGSFRRPTIVTVAAAG